MNKLIACAFLSFLIVAVGHTQIEFDMDPRQSMLMTGKGPGQDATINPYEGEDCMAIIENIGEHDFSARIQVQGEIISETTISAGKKVNLKLMKGQELYLDPTTREWTRARVSYAAARTRLLDPKKKE